MLEIELSLAPAVEPAEEGTLQRRNGRANHDDEDCGREGDKEHEGGHVEEEEEEIEEEDECGERRGSASV